MERAHTRRGWAPEATLKGLRPGGAQETSAPCLAMLRRAEPWSGSCGLAMGKASVGKREFTGRLQVTGKDSKLI